jgi:4-hydroxy-4-methyl-2-oxoglutarate aldolase
MERNQPIPPLDEFRKLSTCIVASAIESFHVRLPNAGFADSRVRSVFEDLPPIAGYAVTARIRSVSPPMEGNGYRYARPDWWNYILTMPAPRIVVLEDLDDTPGLGAFVGGVNANIFLAVGCVGVVTNGAVRDLNEIRATGLSVFAGHVSLSHAYAHICDFGGPVVVGSLEIRPGDLIHGDRHGVQTVPLTIAERVPAVARKILQRRQRIVDLCHSASFSVEKLYDAVQDPG